MNRPRVAYVHERIAIENNEIGPFGGCDGAKIFGMQKLCRAARRRRDHLHRRQAGFHHQLHLPLFEVTGKSSRRTCIRAEGVRNAGVHERLEIFLRSLEEAAIFGEIRVLRDRFLIFGTL